jgi:hypothetical protein
MVNGRFHGLTLPQRGKAATELREAFGVRGACSRFGTTPALRQRQHAVFQFNHTHRDTIFRRVTDE